MPDTVERHDLMSGAPHTANSLAPADQPTWLPIRLGFRRPRVDEVLRRLAANPAPCGREADVVPYSGWVALFTHPVASYRTAPRDAWLGIVDFDPDALYFGFPGEPADERVTWLPTAPRDLVGTSEICVCPGHALPEVLARAIELFGQPVALPSSGEERVWQATLSGPSPMRSLDAAPSAAAVSRAHTWATSHDC